LDEHGGAAGKDVGDGWAPKRSRTLMVMAPVAWRTRVPKATPTSTSSY
jgi:hypothetical protein